MPLSLPLVLTEVLVLGYLERIQVRYISETTVTYIPFVCGCASTCDSSTPLFIVPNVDNECLTSYLRLSNLYMILVQHWGALSTSRNGLIYQIELMASPGSMFKL